MQNYQEWFSIKELMEKNLYLPGSDKGIVKKAAREGWQKRQRQGVKKAKRLNITIRHSLLRSSNNLDYIKQNSLILK